MKKKKVKKISNGEIIDLSKLSKRSLKTLHYEEEKYVAKELLKTTPFSKERMELMRQGYNLVNDIMPWYLPKIKFSYGADKNSTGIVCNLLMDNRENKLIYEAGVGTGYSCEKFINLPNVSVCGCDIILHDRVKALMKEHDNFFAEEDTLYHSLKRLNDQSIDLFYADNVFEHLFPDEIPYILRTLSQKMKKNGLIVLIIPNRLVGPGDVSKYFLKRGAPAEGFHFLEMSYREVLKKFKQEGMTPKYFTWKNREDEIKYIKDDWGILNQIKIRIESCLCLLTSKNIDMRVRAFRKLAMSYYILIKK